MDFVYSDGGRNKYFKAEGVGDCVCRAICNATGEDYKKIYDLINQQAKHERKGKCKHGISSARNGVYRTSYSKILARMGWTWHPTMTIGSGCKTHLKASELPSGTLIVKVSQHLTCVKDGVLYDTYDCSREGTRCVYGYFIKES